MSKLVCESRKRSCNFKQRANTQEAFVQSLADDAVSIDGTDYLPVGKPNSYKDYELIYYINDVTIDNEEVLVEYGAAGTATGTYEYGLQRLSVEYVNEAKEYYLYNGTGNVTQTTAENGSAFLRYTYDAFGNVTSIRAPMTVDIDDLNRYTYNGEDYDYNTGLQYLRARYYSTSTGSFISQDTYLGRTISPLSQNRYTYAHNNPVMYDDPSGHYVATNISVYSAETDSASVGYNDKTFSKATNTSTFISDITTVAQNASYAEMCEGDMPWYEKALNGIGGFAFAFIRNYTVGNLTPFLMIHDSIWGTSSAKDLNHLFSLFEYDIVENYVTNETWFYGGGILGDVASTVVGVIQFIEGLSIIDASLTTLVGGAMALVTGVGAGPGAGAIAVSIAGVVEGAVVAVGGASTVSFSIGQIGNDFDKFNNSRLKWGNPNSVPTYGHTFSEHGSRVSSQRLIDRARAKNHQVGKWTDNQAAADFIAEIAQEGNGVYDVELGDDVSGVSYLPDGTELQCDRAIIVVKADGSVRTAYPYNSSYPH